jgi:hypothetical protein
MKAADFRALSALHASIVLSASSGAVIVPEEILMRLSPRAMSEDEIVEGQRGPMNQQREVGDGVAVAVNFHQLRAVV